METPEKCGTPAQGRIVQPSYEELRDAIARRVYECDFNLLTEQERVRVLDATFKGLGELQRHNC